MEEWNALHDALRGGSVERLNALAPRYGFDVTARRGLRSRSIGGRILAIRTVGHLRDASAWKDLQELLASSNALVSFYAAAALVLIDATRAMPGIMNQLAERESWPGEAMARLLVDAGTDIAREPIRALMLSLAPDKVPPLLPWLSHVDAVLGSEVAIELLRRNPEHEDIAAAALLAVQDPGLLDELAGFAEAKNVHHPREPRAGVRPARRPRPGGNAGAPHERPRLVGALPGRAGIAEIEGHEFESPRGDAGIAQRPVCARHAGTGARRSDEPMSVRAILAGVQWMFLGYFVLLNAIYLSLAFIALVGLRRYMRGASVAERVYSHLQVPVSMIVPAYNEAATIATSVRALLQLRYQHFEVIVVNDGSKDDTLAVLQREFRLSRFRRRTGCRSRRSACAASTAR
jgi:hypothetical protein